MNYWTNERSCVEVCSGDRIVGYAIFFSGGWDAYIADGRASLLLIGTNFISRDGAEKAISAGFDWRKGSQEKRPQGGAKS